MMAWGPARAILLAILRERFNQGWRFSKVKKGIWKYVIQVLLVLFFSGVTRKMFQHAGVTERMVVIVLDALGFSVYRVFMVAPKQMFQPSQHTLPLLTPAPPISVLIGQVLADMPVHLWSMLMFAWVMSSGLSLGAQLVFMAVMAFVGMVIVALSMLAGHLILVMWSKWVPGGLTVFLVLAVIAQVAVVIVACYLLLKVHVIDPAIWSKVTAYGEQTVMAFAVLFGGLLVWFAAKPAVFDRWYLDGWLAYNERGQGKKGKPERSTWPLGLSGTVGSLWAKDLILVRKNPIYKVRIIMWVVIAIGLAVLIGIDWLPGAVRHFHFLRHKSQTWLCVMLAVVTGHLVVAETITTLFELDRNKRNWFVIACTSPWQIMRSKLRSGLLFYLLPCVLLATVFGLLLSLPLAELLAAVLFTALLVFTTISLSLGIAAFDMRMEDVGRAVKADAIREQVPQTLATLVANIASLMLLLLAFIWIDAFAYADLAKIAVFVALSLLSLLIGTKWIGKCVLWT